MNRDTDLIKQVLKYVKCSGPGPRGFLFHPDIPGFSEEQVEYHVRLCDDAGYVRTNSTGHLKELTWAGHDALDVLCGHKG